MNQRDSVRTPKAVHHQCMWIIRDLDRLYRLDAIHRHGRRDDELVFYEDENCRCISSDVAEEASRKIECIKKALLAIPEEYRMDILESIAEGVKLPVIAHENTWKKWKRVFISELASNLKLI